MHYNDIKNKNPKIKAILNALKHYSATIQADVQQAFDEAENESQFIEYAQHALTQISSELAALEYELKIAGAK